MKGSGFFIIKKIKVSLEQLFYNHHVCPLHLSKCFGTYSHSFVGHWVIAKIFINYEKGL